jgi:hypothetical protein
MLLHRKLINNLLMYKIAWNKLFHINNNNHRMFVRILQSGKYICLKLSPLLQWRKNIWKLSPLASSYNRDNKITSVCIFSQFVFHYKMITIFFCISMINFVKMYFEFIYIWQILISTDTAKTKIFNASWNTTLKLEH